MDLTLVVKYFNIFTFLYLINRSNFNMNFIKLLFKSYVLLIIICNVCPTYGNATNKKLEFIDKVYEENIKTPILFRADDLKATPLNPAAISLMQRVPLVLKFDEIYTDEADYYRAKIIHCDFNWQKSQISDLQFLYEYNEFNIDDFEFSVATKVPYTHFTFTLPKVKLPGNYLLVIYREPDEEDVIITKRFVVFDQRIKILADVGLSTGVIERRQNQQIQFTLDYTSFPISNPYLDIKVLVKQNHRWDNAIYDLKPTMVKEDIYKMEYRHFNFDNNFKAGNEFRFFDIRSTHFGGRNVEKTNISETQINAFLFADKTRGTEPYSMIRDLNGGFIIENSEGNNDFLESDYINVHFFLDPEEQLQEDIYIGGKLTNWNFNENNKMRFIEASGLYMGSLLLKQGLYDFIYYVPNHQENPYFLEGNHFETRNEYEIIVYYRDPAMSTTVIVGYMRLE
jgi:hypothetical protein